MRFFLAGLLCFFSFTVSAAETPRHQNYKPTPAAFNSFQTFKTGGGGSNFVLPAGRGTVWQPGVTFNQLPASGSAGNTIPSNYLGGGYGIPNRTTQCGSALTPLGGSSDDQPQILAAMNACAAGQFVKLNCGKFNILSPISYRGAGYITVRGCGPGKGLNVGTSTVAGTPTFTTDATATQLYYGNSSLGFGPIIEAHGADPANPVASSFLASDMVVGSYTATISASLGIAVGDIIEIDQNTDNDPDVYWNINHCFAGAQFMGTISGTVLTVNSVISGTVPDLATNGQTIFVSKVGFGNGAVQINSRGSGTGGTGTYNLNISVSLPTNSFMTAGCATRAFFMQQDRSLTQLFEVATVTGGGTILTFTTPAHHTFCAGNGSCATTPAVTAGTARVTTNTFMYGVGFEEMQVAVGGNNISLQGCAYCWIKHVESYWSNGGSPVLSYCFRCELRDSFIHETPQPVQGGGGYLVDLQWASSDNLVENNVMWSGDKMIVAQTVGGGNVVAYNYTADAFEYTFPTLPESGLNDAHNTTSQFMLVEGNESHKWSGDSFWGGSINDFLFRNNLTNLRPAWLNLSTYVNGGCPYTDNGRYTVDIQAGSYYTNVVGNILGQSGQSLLSTTGPCAFAQTAFGYEDLTAIPTGTTNFDYTIGLIQSGINGWDSTTNATQLRQGNWSWFLGRQTWYSSPIGATGTTSTGSSLTLPNSYYYVQGETQPSFYSSSTYCPCTWPWVDPSSATTHTYPAKARFLNGVGGGNYNTL